jgi:hypothetical protein
MRENAIHRHFAAIAASVLIVASVVGVLYAYRRSAVERAAREELREQGGAPVALLEETEFDWGEVDRNTVVEHDFLLKNPGTVPLVVTAVMTSCSCTTAELQLGGEGVSMPAEVPAGGEGVIHVELDPKLHDVRGDTERAVRIETNDPNRPFLIITLRANVQ